MDHILYIGGVASSAGLARTIAEQLASYYGVEATGFSLGEAYRNKMLIEELAPHSLVITHSAGMAIVKDLHPMELVAVAPPMPIHPLRLMLRAVPKTIALHFSGGASKERSRKIRTYHLHALREHIIRVQYAAWRIRAVSKLDATQLATRHIENETKVTLMFMDRELLFLPSTHYKQVQEAKRQGVVVHEQVPGHHDEFVLYPLRILDEVTARKPSAAS